MRKRKKKELSKTNNDSAAFEKKEQAKISPLTNK